MNPRTLSYQSGHALLMSLLVTIMLFGIAGAYLTLSYAGYESSSRELATAQARLAAEDGISLSIAELKDGVDTDGDGLGTLETTAADGRTISVTATDLGANLWQIHSVAVLRRSRMAADVLVERVPLGTIDASDVRAAITAEGDVATLGNIQVDGRDWDITGTNVVGPGTYGVSSMGAVTSTGSSTIGGNGIAPTTSPLPGTRESNASWADGIDQDADGTTDEELFDGIDDDGDGVVDEDTHDYPTTPDVWLGLAPGTLKSAAMATGTYFTNKNQVNACIAANGGKMPGGVIIYCEFDTWNPTDLGATFNDPPSILVQHNDAGTAVMNNVHGMFRGLVLADFVSHLNGNFVLLGALMSFGDDSIGNAFGNGAANVKLCTAALSNLPSIGTSATVKIRSWSRAAAY